MTVTFVTMIHGIVTTENPSNKRINFTHNNLDLEMKKNHQTEIRLTPSHGVIHHPKKMSVDLPPTL